MGFWDWLVTPGGQAVAHAVEILLIAVAAVLSALAARIARDNRELLNGHLAQHMRAKREDQELPRES